MQWQKGRNTTATTTSTTIITTTTTTTTTTNNNNNNNNMPLKMECDATAEGRKWGEGAPSSQRKPRADLGAKV